MLLAPCHKLSETAPGATVFVSDDQHHEGNCLQCPSVVSADAVVQVGARSNNRLLKSYTHKRGCTLVRIVSMASSRSFQLADRSATTAASPNRSPRRPSASSRLKLPTDSAESSSSAGPAGSSGAAAVAGRALFAGNAAAALLAALPVVDAVLAAADDAVELPLTISRKVLFPVDMLTEASIHIDCTGH